MSNVGILMCVFAGTMVIIILKKIIVFIIIKYFEKKQSNRTVCHKTRTSEIVSISSAMEYLKLTNGLNIGIKEGEK